jgi:hypothetical protein
VRIWTLIATGGILLFAVEGHPSFLNFQIVGLILLMRGAAGLWFNLGAERRARCVSQVKAGIARCMETVDALTADLAGDRATRVPLSDLLGQRGGRERG